MGFCVLAGKAKALQEKSGVVANQTKEEMREELVNTLHKIAADHLISDAPQPVVLANQVSYAVKFDQNKCLIPRYKKI